MSNGVKKIILYAVIILVVLAAGIFVVNNITEDPAQVEDISDNCSSYEPDSCPDNCVVCPPCIACSSISCQAEDFCEEMGIDKDWYKNITEEIEKMK